MCDLISHRMGVWLFVIIGMMAVNWSSAFLLARELPCQYLDSVNITAGAQQKDGSIMYNGIRFTKDQYTKINYILENGHERVTVPPYLRGCLCNHRACIRLCCPVGSFFDPEITEGRKCRRNESAHQFESDVFDVKRNKVDRVILDQHFAYVDDKPCNRVYLAGGYNLTNVRMLIGFSDQIAYLTLKFESHDVYDLQRGHILYENKSVPHKQYCLMASLDEDTNKARLDLVLCFEEDQLETRYNILPYGKWWMYLIVDNFFIPFASTFFKFHSIFKSNEMISFIQYS